MYEELRRIMILLEQSFFLIVFGGSCWAAGDYFLKRLIGKEVVLPWTVHHALAFGTGNIIFSYLITAFGFLGLLKPWFLLTIFISGLILFVWKIYIEIIRPYFKRESKPWPLPPLTHSNREGNREHRIASFILIMVVTIFYVPAILQAAAPPYLRDSMVYHLLCPKAYLEAGSLMHIPGNIYSAFPKGHEVLITLLLGIAGDRAAQGFSILQQWAAISGVYGLVRMRVSPMASMICTIGYATVPPLVYFSGCGYVEPALLMSLSGTLIGLAIFSQLDEKNLLIKKISMKIVVLIGFSAGWMAAVKYTGILYLCLIGIIFMWKWRKLPFLKALRYIGLFTLTAVPGVSWMTWNWVTLGNPVYPMGWFLFGGEGWSEAQSLAMSLYLDVYGMGRGLCDYLLLPWRLSFTGRFDSIRFDGAIGPFLIIFLALAAISTGLLIRRRVIDQTVKIIGFMFAVSSAFFAFGTQQTRFWLPSQMLLCIFSAHAVEWILNGARRKSVIKTIVVLSMTAAITWNMLFLARQVIRIGYYKPVLSMEDELSFLRRVVPGYLALEFINKNLTEHSKIFCVWTGAYGYYIVPPYYTDTFIEDVTFKRLINLSNHGKSLSQELAEAGFTHLFFRLSILEKNINLNPA